MQQQPMQQPAQAAWQPTAAPGYPAAPGYAMPGYPAAAPKPAFDFSKISPFVWVTFGGGLLAFIFSFLPYYTVTASGYGLSQSASAGAWHGFFGWFGALVLLLAALAAVAFAVLKALGTFDNATAPLITLLMAGLGLICVIVALFVFPADTSSVSGYGISVDTGRGVGYWLSLVCAVVTVVGAVMFYLEAQKAAKPALAAYPQAGYPQAGYPQTAPAYPQQATPAPAPYQPAPQAAPAPTAYQPAAPAAPAAYPPATPAPAAYPPAAPMTPQPPAAPAPGGYPSF